MTKRTIALAGITLLLAACSSAQAPTDSTDSSSPASSVQKMDDQDENEAEENGSDSSEAEDDDMGVSAGVQVDVSTPRVIAVNVTNFAFAPNAITTKKGEKVTLRLTSTQGNHGFSVPELGINTPVSEGKTVDIELPSDTTGTFSFRCSVPCGSGHRDMTGSITINE